MRNYKIKEKFSKNIALRDNARELFNFLIANNNFKTIDFENIEFVSRSFANEFAKLEKQNNIYFKKINMNNSISSMFECALEETPKRAHNQSFKIGNVSDVLSQI